MKFAKISLIVLSVLPMTSWAYEYQGGARGRLAEIRAKQAALSLESFQRSSIAIVDCPMRAQMDGKMGLEIAPQAPTHQGGATVIGSRGMTADSLN